MCDWCMCDKTKGIPKEKAVDDGVLSLNYVNLLWLFIQVVLLFIRFFFVFYFMIDSKKFRDIYLVLTLYVW